MNAPPPRESPAFRRGEEVKLWVRHETRTTERRAPIVPADAAALITAGVPVTVEESPQRVFPIEQYAAAGCAVAPKGSWVDAPPQWHILGLKELPEQPAALAHRHIFFGHAYKGQRGSAELLRRFAAGGGTLLDIEYLVDDSGRRLAAFGYWAGYVGAALAVLHHRGILPTPLAPMSRSELDALLQAPGASPRVLVIGALGRCGRGARDALAAAGIEPTCWDLAETRKLDRATLLAHDLLVNGVLNTTPGVVFLRPEDLDTPARRLALIADITCDVTSECNVLPVYDSTTTWSAPVRRLRSGESPVDLIAIDNLPSLLPFEASVAFSAELSAQVTDLSAAPWRRCRDEFRRACRAAGVAYPEEAAHD